MRCRLSKVQHESLYICLNKMRGNKHMVGQSVGAVVLLRYNIEWGKLKLYLLMLSANR